MGFFDEDDPFEELFEALGRSQGFPNRQNKVIRGEQEERVIDFVETKNNIFLTFELPGFNKEDVFVAIKGKKIIITARKKPAECIQSYLSQKLCQGVQIEKMLPDFIKTKKFEFNLRNGILEVKFFK